MTFYLFPSGFLLVRTQTLPGETGFLGLENGETDSYCHIIMSVNDTP